jgi:hypothetical protein
MPINKSGTFFCTAAAVIAGDAGVGYDAVTQVPGDPDDSGSEASDLIGAGASSDRQKRVACSGFAAALAAAGMTSAGEVTLFRPECWIADGANHGVQLTPVFGATESGVTIDEDLGATSGSPGNSTYERCVCEDFSTGPYQPILLMDDGKFVLTVYPLNFGLVDQESNPSIDAVGFYVEWIEPDSGGVTKPVSIEIGLGLS